MSKSRAQSETRKAARIATGQQRDKTKKITNLQPKKRRTLLSKIRDVLSNKSKK